MSTRVYTSSVHCSSRRGVVLVLTLLVITIAALIGTTVLVASRAELGTTLRAAERTRSRALAWSGVQAAMAELAQQRDSLLDGFEPDLTPEAIVFDLPDGYQGVFRLVAIGPDGELAVSENGKFDLNFVAEDVLAKIESIGPDLAREIVKRRESSPFMSTSDLLGIRGVSYDMFAGDAVAGSPFEADVMLPGASFGASGLDESGGSLPLSHIVTVHSFDPNIQAGIGRRSSDTRGDLRLNLNSEWTEDLGREAQKRFGPDGATAIKDIMQSEREFTTMGDVAQLLIDISRMSRDSLTADDWRGALDAVTTTSDWYLPGRIDINHAPVEVLAALPGLDADKAEQIADLRQRLDEDTLQSPYWLIDQKIITLDEVVHIIDHITTRSMQWRIRVEAGIRVATEPGEEATDEFGLVLNDQNQLGQIVVYEAVIDVASQQPRVAYLRDVTQLALATTWATLGGDRQGEDVFGVDSDLVPDDAPEARNTRNNQRDRATDNDRSADERERHTGSDRTRPDGLASESSDSRSESVNNRSDREAGEPDRGLSDTGSSRRGPGGSSDNRIGRWTSHAPKPRSEGGLP